LQAGRQIFSQAESSAEQARALTQHATLARNKNKYVEAEQAGQEAYILKLLHGNRYGQAENLLLLGACRFEQGDYGQAFDYYQHALSLNRLIGSRVGEAGSLHHLARFYHELGALVLAQSYLQAALTLRRNLDDVRGKAEDLAVLSQIHLSRGEYVAARDYAGEALEIFQRFGLRPLESESWLQLGLAQELLGDLTKAEAAYTQAHRLPQEWGNQALVLDAQAGLVRCLLAAGQIDQARQTIAVCLTDLQSRGGAGLKHPIRLYLTAYWVLQAGGNKEKAIVALQSGYELLQKRAGTIADAHLYRTYLEQVPENKELATQLNIVANK
jgi:tetratricopeptide (TPR) repeat protein